MCSRSTARRKTSTSDLDLLPKNKTEIPPLLSLQTKPKSHENTIRDFLKAAAADLKKKNPGFLLLVREGEGVPAAAHARYDGGREVAERLDGLDAAGVEGALARLVEKGAKMPRTAESAGDLPGAK